MADLKNLERDDNIYMAKLAEQAERYDEMVDYMKKVCNNQRWILENLISFFLKIPHNR